MSFSVVFSQKALDVLDMLPQKSAQQVVCKFDQIRVTPFSYLKKLTGTKLWRLRIGKYRAIIDAVIRNKTLYVVRIGLRKNVYD